MDQFDVVVEQPLSRYALHRDAEAFAGLVGRYQRLVLATCRRRLYNPADTDDAVQETFLRLAQSAGKIQGNLGGWLYRCATNTSIDLNRRRSTRVRHETAAAASSEVGEDRQQQLKELREHVDTAMGKLDPEQRELIIQRYFVGRPQVELAAEMNLAASTISYRLDRAIEALRHHLGALGCGRLAGGGTAVVVAMLEAEHASAAVPAALTANLMKIGLSGVSVTGAAVAGSIVTAGMLKVVLGIAAAVVVAVAGVWIVAGRGSSPTVPSTSPRPVAAQGTPASPVIVTGSVADTAQSPQAPRWQTTQPGVQPAVLSGRIMDGAGKPVANATVSLEGGPSSASARTDAQGNYVFRTIKESGNYRLGVQAAGFVPIIAQDDYLTPVTHLTPQSQARRDVVIERGVTIEVTVADAQGQPVPRVNVDANLRRGTYGPSRIQTDNTGYAAFVLPVSKSAYVVTATLEGFAPTHALVTPKSADASQEISFLLSPGHDLKGTIMCSDGKPAAGWSIHAEPEWWASNYNLPWVKVDKDGSFTLIDVGEGKHTLYLNRPLGPNAGISRPVGSVTLPSDQQPLRLTVPVLSPAARKKVTGRVRGVGGRLSYVAVRATSLEGDDEFYFVSVQFGEDAQKPLKPDEGEFSFEALPPGTYRLSFESPEIEPKVIERVKLPGDLPVFELSVVGMRHLAGRVMDAETSKAIPHFAVRARKVEQIGDGPDRRQGDRWTQVTDPDGRFEIELVGPGIYQAQVSLEGHAWLWSPNIRIEKGVIAPELTLKARAGGSLSGVVLDPSGNPVEGVKVIPRSMAAAVISRDPHRFEGDAGSVKTDSHGRFTLLHLAAGEETLKLVHPDYAPLIVSRLMVTDGKTTDVAPASLRVGGTIEGVVYDGDGKPSPRVMLLLQDELGYDSGGLAGQLGMALTEEDGHFRVEHLPAQVVYVDIADRQPRQGVVRRVAHPFDGKTTRLDFGGPTAVRGRLLAGGKPLASRQVVLAVQSQHFGPVIVKDSTDADGRFTLHAPQPGGYTLFCDAGSGHLDLVQQQDVQVSRQPVDLGDVAFDVGDVPVTIEADDPADLEAVQSVGVWIERPDSVQQGNFSEAAPDGGSGGKWLARSIPAGRYRVNAVLKGEESSRYAVSFERKPGASQTPVTLRLPRASATLSVSLMKPRGASADAVGFVTLRSEDSTVQTAIRSDSPQPRVLKLPPGMYRAMDGFTGRLCDDIEPITLKDGEQRSVQMALSLAETRQRVRTQVWAWASDGTPILNASLRIADSSDKTVESTAVGMERPARWLYLMGSLSKRLEPAGEGPLGSSYLLPPGHYSATVQRPGAAPFVQQFDVAAPEASPKAGPAQTVDLVMP